MPTQLTMEKSPSEFCAVSFITSGLFSHFRLLSFCLVFVCLFVCFVCFFLTHDMNYFIIIIMIIIIIVLQQLQFFQYYSHLQC